MKWKHQTKSIIGITTKQPSHNKLFKNNTSNNKDTWFWRGLSDTVGTWETFPEDLGRGSRHFQGTPTSHCVGVMVVMMTMMMVIIILIIYYNYYYYFYYSWRNFSLVKTFNNITIFNYFYSIFHIKFIFLQML